MSKIKLNSPEEQRELFLWRFKDVARTDINERLAEFKRFDFGNKGELEEDQAMMLLESRGETKTFRELRALINNIDADHNHRVSFLEWCCTVYGKSYADLNNFADEEARQAALDSACEAALAAEMASAAIAAAKAAEEESAARRAKELEDESKLEGVAGMKAFFKRQMEGVQDVTKTNEQKIKEEAARRKALREAKQKEKEALDAASKQKSAEEVALEMAEAKERAAALEAEEKARKEEEEKAARAARKAALNAKWGGGGPKTESP